MEVASEIFVVIIAIVIVYYSTNDIRERGIVFIALFVRLGMVFYDVHVSDLPGTGTDTYFFDRAASNSMITAWSDVFVHFDLGARLYVWFVGLIYSVLGSDRFVPQAINALFASLAVVNVVRVFKVFNRKATLAALLVAFWPSSVLYTSLLLRDSVVMYLLSAGVLQMVLWKESKAPKNLVIGAWIFLAGSAFHTGMIVAIPAMMFFVLLTGLGPGDRKKKGKAKSTIGLLLISGILVIGFSSGVGLQKLERLESLDANSLTERQSEAARSRAAYLADLPISGPIDLVLQAPVRTIYFLFSPFPWQVSGSADLLGAFDAVSILCVVFLIVKNIWKRKTFVRARPFILFTCISISAYVFGTSNYGTAIRHRMKFVPVLLVVLAASQRSPNSAANEIEPRLQRHQSRSR